MDQLNQDRFQKAVPFDAFLESTVKNADLWHATARRVEIPLETLARAEKIPGQWKLLVIADDWCGDAVNSLPYIARLAELVPNWELRVIGREVDPELMNAHLTNGTSRSIPVVIALDEEFIEHGWWGPRPAELQQWVLGPGMEMEQDDRYREVRRWYARDRGRTTLDEFISLVEEAASSATAG